MKHLKILGLVTLSVFALTALLGAGTASATKLYKFTTPGANDPLGVGTVIKASLQKSTSALIEDAFGSITGTCTSMEIEAKIEKDEGAPKGKATVFAFAGCGHTVDSVTPGELEIKQIAGTTNGTVFSIGTKSTVFYTVLNQTCIARTGTGTDLGAITGATSSTGQAVFDINAVFELEGCSATMGRLTGISTMTSPTGLIVEAS